jgi:hypothetical protein
MPIVYFEQDPSEDFGVGNFFDERGAATYTRDPETAQRLKPSLGKRVAAESTAAATQAIGAPQAQPDQRLASASDAFAGIGGPATDAAVADVPAPSPGAALVAKTSAVAPAPPTSPAAPVAAKGTGAGAALVSKLNQLPIAQTSTSTSVQKGRDAGKVEGEIGALRTADEALDTTVRENAAKADERAATAAQGEQALAIGSMGRDFQTAEAQRLKAEAVEAELSMLRGEKDADVNPDRIMQNMSTGKKLGMTLLAALSGAFASLAGQPGKNTFLDAIDARIQEDIANQKEQIASGRLRRNNLISSLQQKGATAEQAQLAAESRYYGAAADWARSRIREQNLQGAQLEQANLQIAQLDQQRAARDAQLRQTTEDKVSSQSNVVRAPPAPAAGANMTLDDVLKAMKAGRDIEQLKASGLTQEEYDKQALKLAESATKAREFKNAVQDLAREVGVTIKEGPNGVEVVPDDGSEAYSGSAVWDREKRRAVERRYARLKRADVMSMLREPSASLQDEFAEASDRPFNDANIASQVQFFADLARQAERDSVAGYNDVVVQDYRKQTGMGDGATSSLRPR